MRINQSFVSGMGSGLILASILFGASDLLQADKPAQNNQLPQFANTQPPAAGEHQPASTENGQPVKAPSQSPQPQQNEQSTEPANVKFEISEGMNARQIADLLVKKGIITDADSFLTSAGSRVNSIRIGSYELPLKADHQQVLTVITKG